MILALWRLKKIGQSQADLEAGFKTLTLGDLPKYAPAGLTISISAPSATSLSVHLRAYFGFKAKFATL